MTKNGADVIYIKTDEKEEILAKKIKSIDGIVFPGGSGDYYNVGKLIY